jgi:hypothetical protein
MEVFGFIWAAQLVGQTRFYSIIIIYTRFNFSSIDDGIDFESEDMREQGEEMMVQPPKGNAKGKGQVTLLLQKHWHWHYARNLKQNGNMPSGNLIYSSVSVLRFVSGKAKVRLRPL